jgi:glyceraldehyde-3-phosphate dehydrogenase (NADP+)
MLKNFIKNKKFGYFIDNEWREPKSQEYIKVFSPIDNSLVGELPSVSKEEIDDVIKSSEIGFNFWRKKTTDDKVKVLKKAASLIRGNATDLTNLIIEEVGKPYNESYDEVIRTADLIDFYAEEGRRVLGEVLYSDSFPGFSKTKKAIAERVPIGIVVAIPPFNYPLNEAVPKIVGAIIAGNSVILKSPSQGGITCMVIGEIFRLSGLYNGVLNIVAGSNEIAGDYLLSSEKISAINFTGSTNTAIHIQQVLASRKTVYPTILLGLSGKDSAIVLKDADLDKAVEEIANGAFSYSGQRCTAIKKVIVENDIADKFCEKITKVVKDYFVMGNPRDKKNTIGPVINDKTVSFFNELKKDAIDKGAKIILSGEDNGRYLYPVILDNVSNNMRISWEEPFAPILPIVRVNDLYEALDIANSSDYGLQSSIFTENIEKAFIAAESLDVGNVQINGKDSRGPDNFPFNGVKKSGIGNIQGAKYLIESMTRIKTTVINFKEND